MFINPSAEPRDQTKPSGRLTRSQLWNQAKPVQLWLPAKPYPIWRTGPRHCWPSSSNRPEPLCVCVYRKIEGRDDVACACQICTKPNWEVAPCHVIIVFFHTNDDLLSVSHYCTHICARRVGLVLPLCIIQYWEVRVRLGLAIHIMRVSLISLIVISCLNRLLGW